MGERWLLDEVAHAGVEHLDVGFVAGYDQKQGSPDPQEDLDIFAAYGLDQASTIVDLGAGTGQFAIPAARRFAKVTAVDISRPMLEVLRQKASAAGLHNVVCVEAGFLSYQHTGPLVDGVYTRNALHHLPDFWKALALQRIARLLRPGGILRLRDLVFNAQLFEIDEVLDRWLGGAEEDARLGYTRADLTDHVRTEFSTFRWLLEPMLAAAGFDIAAVEFDGDVYGAYTCVRR